MPPGPEKGLTCVGRFSDPYGVKGGIRLKSFTARLETLKQYQAFFTKSGEILPLSFGQQLKDGFVVTLEGVTTPEAAKSWKGQEVFINKEELKTLPPGEYYHADLVNLSVITMAGGRIGNITGINNFGAGDVIEIELDKPQKGLGKTLLVPFRGDVIKDVDLTKGVLIIDPEGWLEV